MKILLCSKKYIFNHSLPKNNKWFSQLKVYFPDKNKWISQLKVVYVLTKHYHSSPTTNIPHKIHILELIPSSSSHWSLSFCTTKDHTGPPNYETHDDISFSFLHKMPISDDLLASSLHDNSHRLHSNNLLHLTHCPLAHENTIRSLKGDCFLQSELNWPPNILWYNLIILKNKQRYYLSCHFHRGYS